MKGVWPKHSEDHGGTNDGGCGGECEQCCDEHEEKPRLVKRIPVVKLADAYAEPGTVMIVPFNTVIASLAVNGPQRSVDTALDAVLLINVESARNNHIFMLRDVEVVD